MGRQPFVVNLTHFIPSEQQLLGWEHFLITNVLIWPTICGSRVKGSSKKWPPLHPNRFRAKLSKLNLIFYEDENLMSIYGTIYICTTYSKHAYHKGFPMFSSATHVAAVTPWVEYHIRWRHQIFDANLIPKWTITLSGHVFMRKW
jgi:hypothetical protein